VSWAAVVPAAGRSRRMGVDKVLAPVGDRPALTRALQVLRAAGVPLLVVGVRADAAAAVRAQALEPFGLADCLLVAGGATRAETVRRCLAQLPAEVTHVLVHDAARPYCSPELARRVMEATERYGAACAALPAVDTVHRAAAGEPVVAETLDRSRLWLAQTPQGFRRELLERAHAGGAEGTDDAGLVAALGVPVRLVEGERTNTKLTYPEDLASLPGGRIPSVAVGLGQDVHRLVPGRRLVLGGVVIPAEFGLEGHSDADVVAHAVADAVLGAAGLGDIGRHFPPSDERWRGADSLDLLRRCVEMAGEAGWRPVQADCVVTAERPRLGPHVPAMRARLAGALGCPSERVNVKAGTAEGLGALGRGEGIAASAVVLLVRI
jgi:2-C-methyl-D-erythritol 4-phosphate cytidylyltransferase/2-C-methyl-D-erythritol 2,4-cyclodiphosphate synthase